MDGKPITTWHNRDEAFRQVASRIGNTIRGLLDLPPPPSLALAEQPRDMQQKPTSGEAHQPTSDEPLFEPRNPYKGLRAFTSEDAADFFGREHLVESLVTTLQRTLFPQQRSEE